jgi:PIN domain nuclease of toxin-antitoxin system
MGPGMNLLLDSCVLIWLAQLPGNISERAKDQIDSSSNELWFSHASIWEIHLKHLAGKLALPQPPRLWLTRQLTVWGIRDIPIDLESLHLCSDLPLLHKDPFDRLLVAQARTLDATLVSPDKVLRQYGADILW